VGTMNESEARRAALTAAVEVNKTWHMESPSAVLALAGQFEAWLTRDSQDEHGHPLKVIGRVEAEHASSTEASTPEHGTEAFQRRSPEDIARTLRDTLNRARTPVLATDDGPVLAGEMDPQLYCAGWASMQSVTDGCEHLRTEHGPDGCLIGGGAEGSCLCTRRNGS